MSISTFGLDRKFVRKYATIPAPFGWKSGPNSVGEIVCARTYSRFLEERNANERWHEICERVVNGCYKMQELHVRDMNIEWDEDHAQRSAREMYDRMFNMKFLPPGRGLWCMGTDVTEKRKIHAALMNCAFCSTVNLDIDKHLPFCFLMDASMLGVGVGFDCKGAGKLRIKGTKGSRITYRVPDTREGWVESLKRLILAHVGGLNPVEFIYSEIRPRGLPIKTFGGLSSGPDCLIELHGAVEKILIQCKNKDLMSRQIVDIMNLIGACVVAGNVRRTAEIAFGEVGDADFANLKNYKINPDRQAFGWTSNNSINAELGQDYESYQEPVRENGEPGFAWLKNMQDYGRMCDPPNYKDRRVQGSNPCCTGDTKLLTAYGNIELQTLVDSEVTAWNGREWSKVVVRKTGVDEIVNLVTLSDGTQLKCTPYHNWVLRNNNRIPTYQLRKGDQLEKFEMPLVENGKHENTYDMYTHGFYCGDGIHHQNKKGILLYGEKQKCRNRLKGWTSGIPHPSRQDRIWFVVSQLLPEKNYVPHENTVKDRVEWLTGLFDADGHVQYGPNSTVLFLSASDLTFLRSVRLLLTTLGIQGKIRMQTQAKEKLLHAGKGGYALYHCVPCYELMLNAVDTEKLISLGFKPERLEIRSLNVCRDGRRFVAVESVIPLEGLHDVYCATELKNNTLTFDGIVTGQCVEQSLESYELCCLVETFVNRHQSVEDYKRTLKYAYLYAKTVTLGKTHWIDSNRVMLRNRRIGCSISGIQQFIKRKGIQDFKSWCRDGYDHIQKLDEKYSEWFCIPRSVKTTSIKPSGTVSLLTGSTPGMHWPVCNYHTRRITLAKNSQMSIMLVDAGYHVEDAAYDKSSVIVEMPVEPEVIVRDVSQVSMWEQLEMAAFLQEHWSDNQVSCTVSFDPDTEGRDIARALDMYQYRLKGISFLPQKKIPLDTDENVRLVRSEEKYVQMPYSPMTQSEYKDKISNLKRIDFTKLVSREGGSDRFCDGDKCVIGGVSK